VHAAARRGHVHILRYLVEWGRVNMTVCCQQGRTPLHDATWSAQPNFDVIRFLLEHNPEFLLLSDKRGFAPLDYAPKSSYGQWEAFLNQHRDYLLSQVLP
jgi:ankyrin repeat protein